MKAVTCECGEMPAVVVDDQADYRNSAWIAECGKCGRFETGSSMSDVTARWNAACQKD